MLRNSDEVRYTIVCTYNLTPTIYGKGRPKTSNQKPLKNLVGPGTFQEPRRGT